jgi:hypothetical protein
MLGRLDWAILGLVSLCECVCVEGQQNSWTNPTSAAWEEMHWSLGQLPGSGQIVFIENPGWKAVGISPWTAQNFPQTLQPVSVTISAPANSYNVLLLNYSGFETPLSVKQLRIYPNGALIALQSGLQVDNALGGAFSIGGSLNQGANSTVSTASLEVGDIGPGTYNLTNGTLTATAALSVGGNFPSQFNQFGGSNYTADVQLYTSGEYDFFGGSLLASNILYRPATSMAGNFNQYGGSANVGGIYVTMGQYYLAAGMLNCSDLELPGVTSSWDVPDLASFLQTGGTNLSGLVSIGNIPPLFLNAFPSGDYTLSNGVLVTTTTSIGPFGSMVQSGGTHIMDSLQLEGGETAPNVANAPSYTLAGGVLATHSLGTALGRFVQTDGTNQVARELMVMPKTRYNSDFQLQGGLLQSSNTTVISNPEAAGGFTQSGGTQTVTNLLTVSRISGSAPERFSAYNIDFLFSGGQLSAKNIEVDNGAIFHHRGGSLISTGMLTLAGGNWEANTGGQGLGRLALGPPQSGDSRIVFPGGAATLSFSNSSSVAWSEQAILRIEHWNGSLAGGGFHQLYFGNNNSGLRAQQLAQIRFHDPDGMPGIYPATILSSGEVVPTEILVTRRLGNGLTLSWSPGLILQSSTNATGPFTDIAGPNTSSFTIKFSEPMRFFRLRSASGSPGSFANFATGVRLR